MLNENQIMHLLYVSFIYLIYTDPNTFIIENFKADYRRITLLRATSLVAFLTQSK